MGMRLITCPDCKAQVMRWHSAVRCYDCSRASRPTIARGDRTRRMSVQPLELAGERCCADCAKPLGVMRSGRPPIRCRACNQTVELYRARARANHARSVAKAIASGDLPRPADCACVDCGKPAEVYDHRDYTQPLKVDPVCRSCNVMRGPADVWPDPATVAPTTRRGQWRKAKSTPGQRAAEEQQEA